MHLDTQSIHEMARFWYLLHGIPPKRFAIATDRRSYLCWGPKELWEFCLLCMCLLL